jgi:hypothetical protein
MAKTTVAAPSDLSAKTKTAVDKIRKPFATFVKDFASLAEKREELAPRFMKAFELWRADTKGTFVDFTRFLDPSVPAGRNDYRANRSYQAADYLRRLASVAARGDRANQRRTAEERATAPVTPMVGMARVLSSLMSLIPEDQRAKVTEALHEQLHWNDRQVLRLEQLMQENIPLVEAKGKVEFPKKLTLVIPHEVPEDQRAAA